MSHVPLVVALTIAGGFVVVAIDLWIGGRTIPHLTRLPRLDGPGPLVSILIAARNEATHIEQALQSVLHLDYEPYEVIVVDDRSGDATGVILDRMHALAPDRLKVLHVGKLPPGWLGKNYALAEAANAARGSLFLFTDADVVFEPAALSRAVRCLLDRGLDHLAVAPGIVARTVGLEIAVAFFTYTFSIFTRAWKAADPRSRRHIGIGAFNLVRAEIYRRAGGHARIALRPDDDLKLGKIVKEAGGRQTMATGEGALAIEWYRSTAEFVRGLEKNTFAGLDYSIALAVMGIGACIAGHLWPWAALLLTHGVVRSIYAVLVLLQIAILGGVLYEAGGRVWLAVLYPVGAAIFTYTVAAATIKTIARGGIEWRGTSYSLEELRSNRV